MLKPVSPNSHLLYHTFLLGLKKKKNHPLPVPCQSCWGDPALGPQEGTLSSWGFVLVCHLCTLPAPACHKSPRVAKVTLLATEASLVHLMRRDVISWSDNSPTSTANPEFQEEPQTVDACAEPQLGETFEPNAKLQKALFSLFTLGKETRGVRAPQFFSHSQVS